MNCKLETGDGTRISLAYRKVNELVSDSQFSGIAKITQRVSNIIVVMSCMAAGRLTDFSPSILLRHLLHLDRTKCKPMLF